jgi:hypothetical protein
MHQATTLFLRVKHQWQLLELDLEAVAVALMVFRDHLEEDLAECF